MNGRRRGFGRGEDGQILILTALLMTVLLFSVGIAFDLGTLFVSKRSLQEAVDAAAFGGAVAIYNGQGSTAVAAAQTDFAANGYSITDPMIASQAWNWPPATGNIKAADSNYIEIIITLNVRVPLLPAEGGILPVTVRSTAGGVRTPGNYALMALNSGNTTKALWINGGTSTITGSRGIQVNSTNATSAVMAGGSLTLAGGAAAKTVGNQSGFGAQMTTGQPYVADPLSGYLRPATTSLATFLCPGSTATSITGSATLNPGVYCGGININYTGGGGATVTMNPGIYIMKGGGFRATGNVDLRSGAAGIMIFNTLSNYPTETGTCGAMTLSTDAGFNVTSPTSGYYTGMLIFQDSYCSALIDLTANSNINITNGSFYAPSAAILIRGGGNMDMGGQMIADTIQISGSTLNITYNVSTAASPNLPALVW